MSPDAFEWIIVLWFAVVGGAVGSFLNVVVYRLPLGISLIHPPSHCPVCKRFIRWYDNVPVFGWIFLRGRCRDCGCPISARYPLVEAVSAALFGIPAAVLRLSDGSYLPERTVEVAGGIFLPANTVEVAEGIFVSGSSVLPLYGIYLFHTLLLCTLLAAALIEYDRKRPPWRLFVPALLVGVFAPLIWPMLRPVPAWPHIANNLSGAVDGLAGIMAGAALGGAAWLISRLAQKNADGQQRHPAGLLLCLLCLGLYLGWQAVLGIALAAAAVQCLVWPLRRRMPDAKPPPSLWLPPLAFAWILAWSSLVARWAAC